ncbi:hypothetical protein N9Q87_02135 [Porticoccaceae bacterium]|nr:hypothetical protein [Porticoccaceae bacterium]
MGLQQKGMHGTWASRWTFIMAATGSAVGLGNMWKFPYVAGSNGGGAFVLAYIACILLIGVPVMMAEVAIGRRGRQSPINSMRDIVAESDAHSAWRSIGGLGVVAGMLIISFYALWTIISSQLSEITFSANSVISKSYRVLNWRLMSVSYLLFVRTINFMLTGIVVPIWAFH